MGMETSQHVVCYQQQPFATSADNLPGNFEQQTNFQTDNHPYQTNVLPVNPIPSTFQSADNILGPIDPKIASKIKPQTLPKIIRGKRGRPKGSTKKRLEAEKERIKSDSNSNNSSDSGQYQHQCGGSPDFSIIEPKNMAGNFINPINIHEIDPTKPLKVNSRLELQRLMARKIVVIKKDEKTGQEFHELNIEELKRQQRLQKNRISASESRRRQRDYIKLLEEKVQMLEMENKQLKDKLYQIELAKIKQNELMNACLNGPSDADNNTESSNKIPHKSRYTIGGGKRKASATPSSDLLPNNEADPQFYPSFAKKVPKFIGQKFSQASFYVTCLTCLFCLSVGFIGHYSGFYNNSATISSSSSTSAHKLNKRDTSYFTNQIPIQNSFNSRQLFSTPNQKISKKDKISGMSQDLLLLLESTIVMEELSSNIQNGNICRGIYNNEFDFVAGSGSGFRKQNQNKLRVFQQNHDNSESELREKFRQKFKNLKVTHSKNEDPDAGCQHNNSTVSLQKSKTIRNNFLHFAEIYNSTQAKDPFAYEEYKMKNGSKNRKRSTKKSVKNQRKSQQTLLPG